MHQEYNYETYTLKPTTGFGGSRMHTYLYMLAYSFLVVRASDSFS